MNNLGTFLGGAVAQRNTAVQQGFQERALNIQENQMRASEQQAQVQSIRENAANIGESLRQAREQGADVSQSLAAADAQIRESVQFLSQSNPQAARSIATEWEAVRMAIEAMPSQQELAAREGTNSAVTETARYDELARRFGPDVANAAVFGRSGSESITFTDDEGRTFSLTRGNGPGASGGMASNEEALGRGTRTRVNDLLINTSAALDRAIQTRDSFNNQFLNVPERFGFFVDAWRERMNPDALDPERRRELADYTAFRQDAVSDLIETLRELSGAAVTQQEFERLQQAMPNPGTGLLDGDSPTEFQSKMNERIRDLNRVMLRTQIWRLEGAVGVPMDMMSLDAVEGWATERAARIRQRLSLEYPGFNDLTASQQQAAVQQELQNLLNGTLQDSGVPYGQ